MNRRFARRILPALACLTLACGGEAETPLPDGGPTSVSFPANAFAAASSASGELSIELRTAPQPPTRGTIDAELVVRAGGAPVDGLRIQVVPWMVAMGHGSSVVPEVSATGPGTYLVRRVSLFMPGEWQLRLSMSGARTDSAVFTLMVP